MRVAAYCRYSSDNQREESIDAQLRAIKEYCKTKRYSLVKVFIDEALTGTTDNRPEFLRMVQESENKSFDAILVHKLDRFARNRYDSAFYKHRLKTNGVKVISVRENFDDSPESVILESVIEGMNEYYSLNLSLEVKKGMKETALQCRHNGGTPPLGYDVNGTGEYIVNEEEAKAVRRIFELFLGGLGYLSIAQDLSAAGYKAKRSGKPFGKNSIRGILLNEKYTGVYLFGKGTPGEIRIEDALPAIIDKEIYLKAKMKIEQRKREPVANERREYLLTGMIICGECGCAYVGNGYYSGRDGKKHPKYACTGKSNNKGCTNPFIRRESVETYVVNQIKHELLSDGNLESLVGKVAKLSQERAGSSISEVTRLKKNKKDIENKVNRMLDLYLDGGLSKDILDKKSNGLKAELDLLTERIIFMEANAQRSVSEAQIKKRLRTLVTDLEAVEFPKRKKVVAALVKCVYVFKDRVEAVFKIDHSDVGDSVGGGEPLLTVSLTADRSSIHCKIERGLRLAQ